MCVVCTLIPFCSKRQDYYQKKRNGPYAVMWFVGEMFILRNGSCTYISIFLVQSQIEVLNTLFFKYSTYLVLGNAGYIFLVY